ncbi:putative DNA-binding domain-containing protein [Microbulbifer elongatus]|uniref:DNA-binding domain-containing protein n=1 Tax=Microbulbifer elongatus TaxID=86173 RepID=A0ABT1NWY9_9GAMM|nr:putative DNA-binding domain-containing protein [Microbulbifer elongatus]MCQ3828398.1 putative DNA-binding domain-containing protein [Microbulbifer elongatus]
MRDDPVDDKAEPVPKAGFQLMQQYFAAHLRAPDQVAAPAEIEDRRMGIYRDLIYNNIESFIAGGFPVLRSIIADDHWHAMVRDFVQHHCSHSPYFLQISEEFLNYLQNERGQNPRSTQDPPFTLELAHYEWVELALDVSPEAFPQGLCGFDSAESALEMAPLVSPLAWGLSYQFPVHELGPAFQPTEPGPEITCLVVYRNRSDDVRFMATNPATLHLLQLMEQAQEEKLTSARDLILQLATDMQHPEPRQLLGFGAELLQKMHQLDIIAGFQPLDPH